MCRNSILLALISISLNLSAQRYVPETILSVIPQPNKMKLVEAYFELSSSTKLVISDEMQDKVASGAYRPHLTGKKGKKELTWGISMFYNKPDNYLMRWELIDKE